MNVTGSNLLPRRNLADVFTRISRPREDLPLIEMRDYDMQKEILLSS